MSIRSLTLVVFIVLVALTIIDTSYTTLIIDGENKTEEFLVRNGDAIELSFVHSVELSRWIEVYKVHPNHLVLIKAKTKSFGWGLPFNGNFSFEDDWMVFGMNRKFRELKISTSNLNDYTLKIKGKVIKLDDFGDLITLRPEGGMMPWIYQKLRKSFFMKEIFPVGKRS